MTEARSRGLSSFMDGVLTVLHLAPAPRRRGHRRRARPCSRLQRRRPSRDQPRGHPGGDRAGGAPASREVETACERAGFELVVHDREHDLAAAVRPLIDEHRVDLARRASARTTATRARARRPRRARRRPGAPRGDATAPLALGPLGRPALPDPLPRLRRAADGSGRSTCSKPTRASSSATTTAPSCEREPPQIESWPRARLRLGSRGPAQPYAELLTEAVVGGGEWRTTGARELDARDPLQAAPIEGERREIAIAWWLNERSFSERTKGASP